MNSSVIVQKYRTRCARPQSPDRADSAVKQVLARHDSTAVVRVEPQAQNGAAFRTRDQQISAKTGDQASTVEQHALRVDAGRQPVVHHRRGPPCTCRRVRKALEAERLGNPQRRAVPLEPTRLVDVERIDGRGGRLVGRRRPVRVQSKDLAVERPQIARTRRIARVVETEVQLAVWPESKGRRRSGQRRVDAIEQRSPLAERVAGAR